MEAKVTCHPPLGQATTVHLNASKIIFTVVVETNGSSNQDWQVELWTNYNRPGDWGPEPFNELKQDHALKRPVYVGCKQSSDLKQRYFQLTLSGRPQNQDVVSFTVRFRPGSQAPWKWIRDQTSLPDGQLLYKTLHTRDLNISDYIHAFNPELKIERTETPTAVSVYGIGTLVPGRKGKDSIISDKKLGRVAGFTRFFAVVRLWTPWIAPRHGHDKLKLDKDAILCAFQQKDGMHVVILALSGIDDTTTVLKSDDEGNLIISGRNDSNEVGYARILIAVGDTFEEANAAAIYRAREIVMSSIKASGELQAELKALQDGPKPQWLEEWSDGFTYCTWNGLGQNLNEQKIFDALKSLRDSEIVITNLIIDDNWQSLDHPGEWQSSRRWLEFEANKEGFPKGLAHTVQTLRKENPNIKHVAVWHALLGYWGAVSPDGKIAKEYKTMQVRRAPGDKGDVWTVIHPFDVNRFYDDFYRFLSSCGVDSVKTDAQFGLDDIVDGPDRQALTKPYQDAWSIAMLRHFSAKAISCMSQVPQIMFHSQLPTDKPATMVRNSDDFFPDIEDSHPWHVFCNAHNSLFTQHLNALPDWDMFQTSHPWASFHAAARCLSGGPIYFTDEPGKHNVDLIDQMTANTIQGNTIILRPSVLGRSANAYIGYEEEVLLKLCTYNGYGQTGTSFLGIFNVSQTNLKEIISLGDMPGVEDGMYVIHSHTTGQCTVPISKHESGYNFVVLDLPVQGWEILAATPVYGPVPDSTGKDTFVSNLGLIGKMTGGAAITNTRYSSDRSHSVRLQTALKALGTLGIYVSDLDKRSIDNDFLVAISGNPIQKHCVKKGQNKDVFEIDLVRAWREAGQDPGYNNEVGVEILIK